MYTKSPSFRDLHASTTASSRAKCSNKAVDTTPEVMLRRELWHMGLRFRKNVSYLIGKPDIVFQRARILIFCDGDFWHGRDWSTLKSKLEQGANSSYWQAKINSNIERDGQVNKALEQGGWRVIRLWETDIKRDVHSVAAYIREQIRTSNVVSEDASTHRTEERSTK